MFLNTEPSALLLLAVFTLSITLAYISWKSPNPPPKDPYKGDQTAARDGPDPTWHLRMATVIVGGYYIALFLFNDWSSQSSTEMHSSSLQYYLCPNQAFVSRSVFTWSTFNMVSLGAILFGSTLRIFCFRTLGRDFTFQIAMPGKLKTGGLYAWVQHPSYAGAIIALLGNLGYMFRTDGAQGCWIPSSLHGLVFWMNCGIGGLYVYSMIFGVGRRIRAEEGMLREKFGQDWVNWHKKTARLIPGVF